MTRKLLGFLATASLVALLGCPAGDEAAGGDAEPVSMDLTFEEASAPKVGETAKLRVNFSGDQDALWATGAMVVTEERLTQWKAEPADAVEFDPETNSVTYLKTGRVKIMATWEDAEGNTIESNPLIVDVGE